MAGRLRGGPLILLDTHVVLWWSTGDARLSARATREIARADTVLVSPVSCFEIATLVRTQRIAFDRDVYEWLADLFAEERVELAPLSPQAALAGGFLADAFPGDPADRLIYATARELVAPLATKDRAIRAFAKAAKDVRAIW